jgi:integrase
MGFGLALLEMRRASARSKEWVFPAGSKSGHIEKSALKKRHPKACALAGLASFPLYTSRHTCRTRRYVHPQAHRILEQTALERGRVGTVLVTLPKLQLRIGKPQLGHCNETAKGKLVGASGLGEWIRTTGLLVPNQALYQAEPRPEE